MDDKQRNRADSVDTTKSKSNLVHVAEGFSRSSAVIKGYLKKKNSNGKWQKRYFEIVGQYFVYYKNKESDEMLCAMDLWRASAPERIKLSSSSKDKNDDSSDADFAITWDRFREFRAPNSNDADAWVKCMIEVQAKRPDADRRPNVTASVAAKVVTSPERSASRTNESITANSNNNSNYGSTNSKQHNNGKVEEWSSPEKVSTSKKTKEKSSNGCCIIM